jgi:cytochrome c oxidase subunit 2
MNHSGMIGSVVVMEPREFDDWLSGNTASTTPAAAGQQLYQTLGCASCHGTEGEGGRGPSLAGIFGKEQALQSGQSVTVDEGYIRESIVNPQAKMVIGFGPIMPTFQGQVTEDQLVQMVAYIKSLHGGGDIPARAPGPSPTPNR